MKFEIQFDYSVDTELCFGSTKKETIGNWLYLLLNRYEGHLVKSYPTGSCTSLIVEFEKTDQAQDFFREFHEKLSPRMFTQSETGEATFINADTD